MAEDNVLFSIDYSFEKMEVAARFMEMAAVSEVVRVQVASGNANHPLGLGR